MSTQNQGCLAFLLKLFGIDLERPVGKATSEVPLPYRLRDHFLSPAELSFFQVLRVATSDRFHICSKVRISDLLYVVDRRKNISHANRIDRKHVDFVLCTPNSMVPRLVIELDDSTHQRKDRKARDLLVDRAFAVAELPILHVTAKRGYSAIELAQQIAKATPNDFSAGENAPNNSAEPPVLIVDLPSDAPIVPNCPKCNIPMVERKAAKGQHKGKRFWACPSYPDCRKIVAID